VTVSTFATLSKKNSLAYRSALLYLSRVCSSSPLSAGCFIVPGPLSLMVALVASDDRVVTSGFENPLPTVHTYPPSPRPPSCAVSKPCRTRRARSTHPRISPNREQVLTTLRTSRAAPGTSSFAFHRRAGRGDKQRGGGDCSYRGPHSRL
jgi:hypothetical protein